MEYTVSKLAQLAGVSPRTLRYYDEIGLLRPASLAENGYRLYGQAEVDTLQQILFYRALGVELGEISAILASPSFKREEALQNHLSALLQKKAQMERLIETVTNTIAATRGECSMSDKEKFEGFKQELVEQNEVKYGKEARERYGETAVDAANAKLMGLSEEQYARAEALQQEMLEALKAAMQQNDPAGPLAQKACDLHRQWLCHFWAEGAYSKQAHKNLGELYVADDRFTAYYDERIAPGAAAFLCDALSIYCQ